jgi:hypothetical protein
VDRRQGAGWGQGPPAESPVAQPAQVTMEVAAHQTTQAARLCGWRRALGRQRSDREARVTVLVSEHDRQRRKADPPARTAACRP